jgi:prepilin-type processing-associated H-X9-DG protein
VPYTKQNQIKLPSQSLLFIEEGDPRGYELGTWVMDRSTGVGNSGWVDGFAIFHGTVTSFSFADGHVESHSWRDGRTIKAATDQANGIFSYFWPGGDKNNPDYIWTWNNYRFQTWTPL